MGLCGSLMPPRVCNVHGSHGPCQSNSRLSTSSSESDRTLHYLRHAYRIINQAYIITQVLKLQLPTEVIESAVRTYCLSTGGKQCERAAVLFEGILERGVRPSETTTVAVFEALAKGKQVGP